MRHIQVCAALLALSACVSTPAAGREDATDRGGVLEVVQAFLDVIGSKDVDAGARLVVPDGAFVNVRKQDGARELRHFTNAEWLARLPGERQALHEAFAGAPKVLLDGDVAIVWGRYTFDIDGERSHVGTDAFCLVRTESGWRIAGGVYSVER